MKQMVMFEPSDLALLRQGKSLTLRVGDQEVTLGYAGSVTVRRNGDRPTAPEDLVCPTCGKTGFQKRLAMLEHHRRRHGRPAPGSKRRQQGQAYATERYRTIIVNAYGDDRCSVCKKPNHDLRLFPATPAEWQNHWKRNQSGWITRREVAEMIQKDGIGATKKLWHYGCRACMHAGANAARKEA